MAKKLKDTDYLFISTYLHSRERDLLTGARMERMIEAPTAADAAKVLGEIGYGEFDASSQRELGSILAQEQEKLFEDLYRFVPDKAVVDVFKVKYDYHNLKALIKARATGTDASDRLLLDAGRVSAEDMRRAVWEGDYNVLPPALRQSAVEAAETLSATGDPQLADFLLARNDALIIESFGVGGLPTYKAGDYYDTVKAGLDAGRIVVMTTQVENEGSDLAVYHVGNAIKRDLPILEAYDMTTEAVCAKLMWILGQTADRKWVEELFYTPVACDILAGK